MVDNDLVGIDVHAWRVVLVGPKDHIAVGVNPAGGKGLREELAVGEEPPVGGRAAVDLSPARRGFSAVLAYADVALDPVGPGLLRVRPRARLGVVNVAAAILDVLLDPVVVEGDVLRAGGARGRAEAVAGAAGAELVGAAVAAADGPEAEPVRRDEGEGAVPAAGAEPPGRDHLVALLAGCLGVRVEEDRPRLVDRRQRAPRRPHAVVRLGAVDLDEAERGFGEGDAVVAAHGEAGEVGVLHAAVGQLPRRLHPLRSQAAGASGRGDAARVGGRSRAHP